jgi:hypothetical protein
MTNQTKDQLIKALQLFDLVKRYGFTPSNWTHGVASTIHDILFEVDTNEIRRGLSLPAAQNTYRLKLAIGTSGKVVALERFPNDKKHAGLNDMLEVLERSEYYRESSPGIYLADVYIEENRFVIDAAVKVE